MQTGRGAAKNALLALQGKEPESVTVKLHGTMVSIGNSYAVADLMGYKPPNLIARAMKFMVNAHYLWEICGFWKVAQYFYHEVYERRHRKGFWKSIIPRASGLVARASASFSGPCGYSRESKDSGGVAYQTAAPAVFRLCQRRHTSHRSGDEARRRELPWQSIPLSS